MPNCPPATEPENTIMNTIRLVAVSCLFLVLAACAGPSNSQVQLAQEQHSCAALGLAPGSQAFGQCVGNLDASIFEANNTAAR
jgi:hypothetical protein